MRSIILLVALLAISAHARFNISEFSLGLLNQFISFSAMPNDKVCINKTLNALEGVIDARVSQDQTLTLMNFLSMAEIVNDCFATYSKIGQFYSEKYPELHVIETYWKVHYPEKLQVLGAILNTFLKQNYYVSGSYLSLFLYHLEWLPSNKPSQVYNLSQVIPFDFDRFNAEFFPALFKRLGEYYPHNNFSSSVIECAQELTTKVANLLKNRRFEVKSIVELLLAVDEIKNGRKSFCYNLRNSQLANIISIELVEHVEKNTFVIIIDILMGYPNILRNSMEGIQELAAGNYATAGSHFGKIWTKIFASFLNGSSTKYLNSMIDKLI